MFESTLSFPCNVNKDFVPFMQITLPQVGKATGRPGSEQTYISKRQKGEHCYRVRCHLGTDA